MIEPIIKMKSPVKKWEAITIISIMAIVIVDAIVFPILTRNVMPLLGRANWLEIIFRIIIYISFLICLCFHKKPNGSTINKVIKIGKKGEIQTGFFYEGGDLSKTPIVITIIPKVYKVK
jgi:hypothetical protein